MFTTLFLLTGCVLYDRDYYERALLRFEDNDGDRWSEAQGDCDDTNVNINPWEDEYCNGTDDDCNELVDDEPLDVIPWYQDNDGDGFGLMAVVALSCSQPEGYVQDNADCDDADPTVNPAATEICGDSRDLDCSGRPDNWDEDEDGFIDCEDCDDDEDDIYPGAPERCNLEDDDCDGAVDEEDAIDPGIWYPDADGDGYGTGAAVVACSEPDDSYVDKSDDCDDQDATVNPDVEERCHTGVDDNCNGLADGCRPEGDLVSGGYISASGVPGPAIGDLTGDGMDEFMVMRYGSGRETVAEIHSGPIRGGIAADDLTPLLITGPTDGANLGLWMMVLGDTNRDEQDEWVIGGDLVSPYVGSAYQFTGRYDDIDMDISANEYHGTEDRGFFGISYDAPGDIDGDLKADFVIAQRTSALVEYGGAVHIYLAPVGDYTDLDADITVYGTADNLYFGQDVSHGDFDGDGQTDLVVGAPGHVEGSNDVGSVLVYRNGTTDGMTQDDADVRILGFGDSGFGAVLVAPGDVDDDGREDLWVAATLASDAHLDGGENFLFTDLTASGEARVRAAANIVGEAVYDRLGEDAMIAVDFDADGHSDLITQSNSSEGANSGGKIYLFYGPFTGTIPAEDAHATYVGSREGAFAGAEMYVPGDIDGDGELDLMWYENGTASSDIDQISFFYGWTW